MNNNLASKFLKFAVGPLGGALIGFITVPITTWLVSPEQFGLTTMFTLMQTLITSFIYLGIDQAYVREYNSYKGSKQTLLFNALIIPMGIAVVIMGILLIFMNQISVYLFTEMNMLVMTVLVVWVPFVVIERFLLLNIRMQEKGLQYSLFSILVKISSMILTITLLLSFERTYTSIVLGAVIGQIIANLVLLFASRHLLNFKDSKIDKLLIKRMIHFGLPILPAMMITWILNSTDRLALDYFSTTESIGIYFAAMKLVSALTMIQSIFATFWVPVAYRWHEEKVPTKQFTQVSYVLTTVMGLVFMGILLFKELAVWILSPDYAEAQYILPFLLFMPIMYTMSETTVLGIAFVRKTHWNIWISFFAALVNVILNISLVPYIGAIGAAIGTGLAYVSFFWLRTLISRRYWYQLNLSYYMLNTIMLLIVATLNVFIQNNSIYMINTIAIILFLGVNFTYLATVFDFKELMTSAKRKK